MANARAVPGPRSRGLGGMAGRRLVPRQRSRRRPGRMRSALESRCGACQREYTPVGLRCQISIGVAPQSVLLPDGLPDPVLASDGIRG